MSIAVTKREAERRILAGRGPELALALLMIAASALFSWLSMLRHLAYQSHAFDLGNMEQAVWNTWQGRPLRFTDMAVGNQVLLNRLAIHVEPVLLPISLLFAFHAGPATLLVLQSLVVVTGAVPAYLLARRVIGRRWLALAFPLAYLLHPSLQNALLDDFHAVTMSASILLWAIWFAEIGAVWWFGLSAVLAAGTKENIGLLVAALGIYLWARGRRMAGSITVIAGIAWFMLCVAVIIPHANPEGHSPYLARYAYLGHGFSGVVKGAVFHPGRVLAVLLSPSRLDYSSVLLHPLGYVSLLAPWIVLLATPSILINLLSTDPTMYSGYYQYSAEVVPFVVAAAALGVGWVSRLAQARHVRWAPGIPAALSLLVAFAALAGTRLYGFTPLAAGYIVPSPGAHQRLEDRLLAGIPAASVVSAADEMEPHLADRSWIYLLPMLHPRNGPAAAYVVLDASVPSLPVSPHTLYTVAMSALRHAYGVQEATDGILVLRRGAPQHDLPASFYRFAYTPGTHIRSLHVRWGPIHLQGIVVHPRTLEVNRSRPAVEVESWWRVPRGPVPRITLYLSPVYTGAHPAFSRRWQRESDSPAQAWLPPQLWHHHAVHVASLPLLPNTSETGWVDVAVGVPGREFERGGQDVAGAPWLLRVATVRVGY